jgi:toxic protein SymE
MGKRILKIYQSVAYAKPDVPCIILQGKCLRALGFRIGDHVAVEEGEGELVIRSVRKETNKEQQ